jgi:hypothetical protein
MIETIKKIDSRLILLGGIVILVLMLVRQCEATKTAAADTQRYKNNVAALSDTIEATKNKLGKIQYEKSVLVASYDELKELNADLINEIDAQKGKIAQLTKIIAILSTPHPGPIPGTGVVEGNPCDSIGGSFISDWSSKQTFDTNNWRILAGKTTIKVKGGKLISNETLISDDQIGFDLITGLEKKNDHYEIFVRSNYPGFKPTKIDGAVIPVNDLVPPPPVKHWSLGAGAQVGAGITTNGVGGYIGLGISLQYTLLKF